MNDNEGKCEKIIKKEKKINRWEGPRNKLREIWGKIRWEGGRMPTSAVLHFDFPDATTL